VGGGVECVVVGVGAGVGAGVECVVVIGVGAGVVVVEVLCVVWCAALCFLAGFFGVVDVVGVVAGLAVVVELDDDDPQPAATSARLTRPAVTIESRLIRIFKKG
jgi:hypothetical protein